MDLDFYISNDRSKLNIDLICNFLSNRSYWANGRTRSVIEKSINNSLCFGVYEANGQQVGFARIISDFAVFAWLLDVFILEEYRGRGLGKMLMNSIVNHEDLKDVKRWGLGTKDAHGLYEQYGFRLVSNPQNMMERS
jgi:GNAT superfamily N-acetyltransferase